MGRILYFLISLVVVTPVTSSFATTYISTHDPASTIGVNVQTELEYSCASKPILNSSKLEGWKKVGFIFGTEYKMEGQPTLGEVVENSCSIPKCTEGKSYQVPLSYKITAEFGITFSLGIGTFNNIWSGTVNENHTINTPCECCSKSSPEGS